MPAKASERPRVLFVCFRFPPMAAVSCSRAVRFVKHLDAAGVDVLLLTADPHSDVECGIDATQPVPLDRLRAWAQVPSVDLVKRLSRRAPQIRPRTAPPESAPRPAQPGRWAVRYAKDVASDLLRTPDHCSGWIPPAVVGGIRLGRIHPPTVVLATAPPQSALIVGMALANWFRVPFVADLRDPWVGNPFAKHATRVGTWLGVPLEALVLRRASLIIANTQRLGADVAARHSILAGRIVTVPNGVDEDDPVLAAARLTPRHSGRGLLLVHLGSLYGNRSPKPVIDAFRHLAAHNALVPGDLHVRFIGECSQWGTNCRRAPEHLAQSISFLPRQPRDRALRMAAEADALLLLQPDAPLQIPAKLFEYVALGRTILTVAPEGATADLVREWRLGPVCSPEPRAIAESLRRLVRQKRAGELSGLAPAVMHALAANRLMEDATSAVLSTARRRA